jgi:hypothetical protein
LSAPTAQQVVNFAGLAESYSPLGTNAELAQTNAFFQDFGTTGRTCLSCHGAPGGWTTSHARLLWDESDGNDPLFQFTHDIGTCPEDDVTNPANRRKTMVLALERGSARGGNSVSPTAEFEIVSVDDPYGCNGTSLSSFFGYRKPNPIHGISQKTSVTWAPAPQPDMRATLKGLFVGATRFHGATTYMPTEEEQNEAADFMLNNFFAQIEDNEAGRLDADGARGGPIHMANQPWHEGINHASTGPTTRKVFDIYDAWIDIDAACGDDCDEQTQRRALIAEGQEIFNFRQNANGGTCTGCHNSPNIGSHSVYRLFDVGIVDAPDTGLPRATIRNKTTGQVRVVTNLGRANATGKWTDVGRMVAPVLRGLASRAPYFNSGQARTLHDVVDHYDQRFNFGFSEHERAALVAFLSAL